mmetsp:Transcript_34733/g.85017  ORF Transcript_34733/g.85017 Transcript_34733/m.85017 type:complete len:264 (+) Transcript_34733:170-961(+)
MVVPTADWIVRPKFWRPNLLSPSSRAVATEHSPGWRPASPSVLGPTPLASSACSPSPSAQATTWPACSAGASSTRAVAASPKPWPPSRAHPPRSSTTGPSPTPTPTPPAFRKSTAAHRFSATTFPSASTPKSNSASTRIAGRAPPATRPNSATWSPTLASAHYTPSASAASRSTSWLPASPSTATTPTSRRPPRPCFYSTSRPMPQERSHGVIRRATSPSPRRAAARASSPARGAFSPVTRLPRPRPLRAGTRRPEWTTGFLK